MLTDFRLDCDVNAPFNAKIRHRDRYLRAATHTLAPSIARSASNDSERPVMERCPKSGINPSHFRQVRSAHILQTLQLARDSIESAASHGPDTLPERRSVGS